MDAPNLVDDYCEWLLACARQPQCCMAQLTLCVAQLTL